jgi:DNA-binding MarR family transcriptional regulator
LNLINLAKKTGTLVVEGPVEPAKVIFREGKLAFATIGREDNSLAEVLYRNKKISVGQLRIIKERASAMSDKELGLLLINAGYLTQDDIFSSLQQHMVDIVRRLYHWAEGLFRFDNDYVIPEDKIAVRVDLENLIIEGARQMREREQLHEEIPSLDMALKFTERPGTNLRNINLSVEEWRVVSYINPRNSIRQIARATKMNDLEIRRVVYSLLQAGLIEVIRPEGASVAVIGRPVFQTGNKEEQKSLVNRIISRIRSL